VKGWKFAGAVPDGERFLISGVNVWDHQWERVKDEFAFVKDPSYGRDFKFQVYEIRANDRTIRFAAGEFSNCIWGFYIDE
jgi:hypothetical protein